MSDLITLLKVQKQVEIDHVETLRGDVDSSANPLVGVLLNSILLDSTKHAAICQELIDVDAGSAPVMLEIDMGLAVELSQKIKQHVNIETRMIKHLEGMLEKVEDDRVKYILEMMLDDERRHHSTLKELSSLLDRNETAFEEYMELFQKYMIVPP